MVNNISAGREVVIALEGSFAGLLAGLTAFVQSLPAELLYRNPNPAVLTVATVGENVLKCAAILEQVFGGLTANLWDDPFEWTLRFCLLCRRYRSAEVCFSSVWRVALAFEFAY